MSLVRLARQILGSTSSARAISTQPAALGLEDFFEQPLKEGQTRAVGRAWKAADLRLKSWDDLHKLWYVLLKERTMLKAEQERCKVRGERLENPSRIPKVRKAMSRLKLVLSERAHADPNVQTSIQLRQFINAL